MANKFHNKDSVPSKQTGGKVKHPSQAASISEMKMSTANWAGLPGGTQNKDRSGGTPKKGTLGSFYVKQEGL